MKYVKRKVYGKKHGYKYTIFDKKYLNIFESYNWYISKEGYLIASIKNPKNEILKQKTLAYHRLLLNLSFEDKRIVDHINQNKLDNRLSNIRICTRYQNSLNKKKHTKNSTSKYKGVHFQSKNRPSKWVVQITVNNKQRYIGSYKSEIDAAIAYNKAAIKLHGKFACLNKIKKELVCV